MAICHASAPCTSRRVCGVVPGYLLGEGGRPLQYCNAAQHLQRIQTMVLVQVCAGVGACASASVAILSLLPLVCLSPHCLLVSCGVRHTRASSCCQPSCGVMIAAATAISPGGFGCSGSFFLAAPLGAAAWLLLLPTLSMLLVYLYCLCMQLLLLLSLLLQPQLLPPLSQSSSLHRRSFSVHVAAAVASVHCC